MSNLLTYFISLSILVISSSCGVKKNSSKDIEGQNVYINAVMSSMSCGGKVVEDIESKIIQLEKKLEMIKYSEPTLRTQSKKSRLAPNQIVQTNLSKSHIVERAEKLQQTFLTISDFSITKREVRKFRRNVNKLRIDFDRWSFHQCHLTDLIDNDDQEINNYIELESSLCKENCSESVMDGLVLNDDERREKTISVCSLFDRVNRCRVNYDISIIFDTEQSYIEEVLKKAKGFYEKEIFGMSDSPLDIECENREKKEITIPIFQNENSVSLVNAISENWKRDDIEIKFKLGSTGVRLELVDSGLSRVSLNELSTIYLNKNIAGIQRVKTIAHEFGHTLGFKDCYIEYFDINKEEIVYYELEREKGNLMCSLEYGTNIPDKYLDKVVSKYCK